MCSASGVVTATKVTLAHLLQVGLPGEFRSIPCSLSHKRTDNEAQQLLVVILGRAKRTVSDKCTLIDSALFIETHWHYLSNINSRYIQYKGNTVYGNLAESCDIAKKGETLSKEDGCGRVYMTDGVGSSVEWDPSYWSWRDAYFWMYDRWWISLVSWVNNQSNLILGICKSNVYSL